MFQRICVSFSIVACLAASAAAQVGGSSAGQIRSLSYGDGAVTTTSGMPGVRVLSIVGEPIIEPNTGKRLKYLLVDPYNRQIGAVIDSPAGSDHSFRITSADGEIDSSAVNVSQWAVARSASSNGYANFYGPDGSVRLVVAPGSGTAPTVAPAVSYPAPAMSYPAPAPVMSYPTYSYPTTIHHPVASPVVPHYSSSCGCR